MLLPINHSLSERELTIEERCLIRWMLEHGEPEARHLLPQLEQVRVASWRCPCGCASMNFSIEGQSPQGGMNPVADFCFGSGEDTNGVFVYEINGVLAGVEVFGFINNAAKTLPTPEMLRLTFDDTSST